MNLFILGTLAMGYAVAGLFFLRFWRATGDRLFLSFAAAFGLLCLTRILLAIIGEVNENATYLYWIRLTAFVLILWAIIDKNRPRRPAGADDPGTGHRDAHGA